MPIKVQRTFKGETSRTGDGGKEEVWGYLVHTDSLAYTVTASKSANDGMTAIPAVYAPHPTDFGMYCADVQSSRDSDQPMLFRVTVTWRSPTGDGSTGTNAYDIELGFDRETYSDAVNFDLDNKRLESSAGEAYEPYTINRSDAVYLYSYSVRNLNWIEMGEAHGCVNSDTVSLTFNGLTKTFPKYTLKIEPRFSVTAKKGSDVIYRVECRLTERKTTWYTRLVDQGTVELEEGSSNEEGQQKRKPIVDANNTPITSPVLLNGSGNKLESGQPANIFPVGEGENDPEGNRLVYLIDFGSLPGFGG